MEFPMTPRPFALCMASALCVLPLAPALAQHQPAPAAGDAQPAPAARFKLSAIEFSPTVAIPAPELQAEVAPFLGRDISSAELPQVVAAVRRLYEKRGLGLVGIGLPAQPLHQGVLKVAIVEPRITRVLVDHTGPAPVSDARAEAVLSHAGLAAGRPLNLQQLDRAMFTLNDWPGVSAKATLTPGGDEGTYGVAVQTRRGRAWDASVDADNYGTRVSGRYRMGALLRWNNPTGSGDNLDLRAVLSDGSGNLVGRLGYEVPIGATPWRGGLGYSRVNYELSDTFDGAVGTADVVDASLAYPLLRSRERNLVSRLALEDKKLSDEFGGRTDKHIQAATLSLSFESRDAWHGGGFSGGTAGLTLGRLRDRTELANLGQGATASPVEPSTLGKFTKLAFQLTRLQALTRSLSLFTGLAGQLAHKNLDNAEKLTLGGARGVRAYPAAEAASDQGILLNTELRLWINPQWSSFVFYDVGHGRLLRAPGSALASSRSSDNTRTLHGVGLGVQFTHPELPALKASLGRRGDEPVLSDTDNSRSLLLVQVQHSF